MPLENPHIGDLASCQVVKIHVVTPRAEIEPAMRTALHEISTALQQHQVRPAGPWFAHHHRRPTDTFDFDVCFPVEHAIEATGRLENGRKAEENLVVRTAWHGPYEGLPEAWREFHEWIRSHGYKTREDAYEIYSVAPPSCPHPQDWQTDLICPLQEMR